MLDVLLWGQCAEITSDIKPGRATFYIIDAASEPSCASAEHIVLNTFQ